MSFNYKLFKEHINCFDFEKYIKNNSDSFQAKYNDFYGFYEKIIKDEIEKTKQLNAKFSKNINEKHNKFHKFNRTINTPIEFKKVCSFESIGDENEKLNIIIRTYLNKISTHTYEKVTDQLIEKLLENKNTHVFKILSEEIVNKCIYDYKYRNLYINLCAKIWNNKKIHYNLIKINKNNDKYYACYNIDDKLEENEEIGPFDSIDKLKESVFRKINFKNFFVDFLQELYYKKELEFDNLNDDQFFNMKKKTLLLVELLSILFVERHINFDIINLIIIDLLHQDDNFNLIKEIEFELLHVMIKFIFKNNKSFKFIEYKKIISKFNDILVSTLNDNTNLITKRSKYFIEEIMGFFKKILNNERFEDNKKEINNIENIYEYAQSGNCQLFKENLIQLNNNDQKNILVKIINESLEKLNKNMIKTIKYIKHEYNIIIENTMINIINNLDDIILDIPNINENIITFINDLNLNNKLLKKLDEKMSTIDNDSDDDDFSFR